MRNISDNQIREIIQSYRSTNSILETAKNVGVSTVKVRKVLITEGLWESDTSNKIGKLLNQGYKTEEIAELLCISIKNVQAYMPYERGIYGGEQLSADAVRSGKYRNRMKKAAEMQVARNNQSEENIGRDSIMKESKMELRVLKLHLELNMGDVNEKEWEILKKYGYMTNSISRDILVPSDITLHALHYAILRCFGWQNGHLHHFSLPREVFEELTDKQFITWAKLAGVYFRFPTENYEDIYWDDDYEEGQSFKSWLKKKYTGPYRYKGVGEHYLYNQFKVKEMFSGGEEISSFFNVYCHELLERLPLMSVLQTDGEEDIINVKKYLRKQLEKINFEEIYEEYECTYFKSMKQQREFLEQHNISVLPVTKQLNYCYDYGDGWKVEITCDRVYRKDELEQRILEEVLEKHRPICVAKDGIELVDDVGGIHGFCQMLETIYGCNFEDEEAVEERESVIDWAQMMGWTGRRIGVKQTL